MKSQNQRAQDHAITKVEKTLQMIKSNYKPTIATTKPKVSHLHIFQIFPGVVTQLLPCLIILLVKNFLLIQFKPPQHMRPFPLIL